MWKGRLEKAERLDYETKVNVTHITHLGTTKDVADKVN